MLEGMKIWVLMRPLGFRDFKSRMEFWEGCSEFLEDSPNENGFYGERSERHIIYATSGDIMYVLYKPFVFRV